MPRLSLCWLVLLLPAQAAAGEILFIVEVKPSFFAVTTKPGATARRVALPGAADKPPAGLVIVLDGDPLVKEKFERPVQPIVLEIGAYGFNPPLLFAQSGVTLEIDNRTDKAVKLSAEGLQLESVPARGKISRVISATGHFTVADQAEPMHKTTLVIAPSVYVAQLDDTGEFLFDDLPAGEYKIHLYGFDSLSTDVAELAVQSAHVEAGRTTIKLALPLPASGAAP